MLLIETVEAPKLSQRLVECIAHVDKEMAVLENFVRKYSRRRSSIQKSFFNMRRIARARARAIDLLENLRSVRTDLILTCNTDLLYRMLGCFDTVMIVFWTCTSNMEMIHLRTSPLETVLKPQKNAGKMDRKKLWTVLTFDSEKLFRILPAQQGWPKVHFWDTGFWILMDSEYYLSIYRCFF